MEKLWILLLVMGVFLLGITGCEWGSEVQSGENAQTPQEDEPATLLPEQTPQLFFEKRWLFVKNDEAAAELPALLARHGIREAVLVLSPRFRNLSDGALRRLLTSLPLAAPPERFAAPVSGFLELFLGKVRLQSP